MMSRVFLGVVAIALTGQVARSQGLTSVVDAKLMLETDAVHAGSTVKAAAEAHIASGFHINDHHPSLDYLIPTELKILPTKQVEIEKIDYPKGKPSKFAFAEQPLSVYQGTLLIPLTLKVSGGIQPGNYELKGKLAYQACNDHACLPPTSVPVSLNVKVVAPGAPVKRTNESFFSKLHFN
jgi:DsbC/DsbD-like thiol-disulfide interchange protein